MQDFLLEGIRKIAKESTGVLPSVRQLAESFKVSIPSVLKVLKILKQEGLILGGGRRKYRLASSISQNVVQSTNTDLFLMLRHEIRDGFWKVGKSLPKIEYFISTKGFSRYKVRKAYSELVKLGLAYRKGKSLIVGSRLKTYSQERKKIIILMNRIDSWETVINDLRTEEFVPTFMQEISNFGIDLLPFSLTKLGKKNPSVTILQNIQDLDLILQKYKRLLLGVLIVLKKSDFPEFNQVFNLLSNHKVRTVWFDRAFDGHTHKQQIYHCYASEERVCEKVLQFLASLGHKKILFPFIQSDNSSWQKLRYDTLCNLIQKTKLSMSIVFYNTLWLEHSEQDNIEKAGRLKLITQCSMAYSQAFEIVSNYLSKTNENETHIYDADQTFIAGLQKLSEVISILPDNVKRAVRLLWAGIALNPIALKNEFTCIIAPNDYVALHLILPWIRDLNMSIPSDVSIIGFDNVNRYLFGNFSTVDFGFGYLGYQAAHALIDDIEINSDQQGRIISKPSVIDRGSVKSLITQNTENLSI